MEPTTYGGDAHPIKGKCIAMCPEEEKKRRVEDKDVSEFEFYPGTKIPDEKRMVKNYRRSAAGEMPKPDDVRLPSALNT